MEAKVLDTALILHMEHGGANIKVMEMMKDIKEHIHDVADIEELAPELIAEKRHIQKGVSPNVDFYSGFVYEMLGIPPEQGNEKRKGPIRQ